MKMMKKGFTLIELLVVIGVLAVLMAGVVALIDPVDKNRQAQDSKVMSDIGQYATGLQSYVAQSTDGNYPAGNYAAAGAILVTAGELTSFPVAAANVTYTYNGGGTDSVSLCGTLQSKKYTATPFWVWESINGQAGPSATCP